MSQRIDRNFRFYPAAAVLAFAVLFVFRQAGEFAFVSVDDGRYVSENPIVLRGLTTEGVRWAFSAFHAGNWHPLTWLSHMLDVELFGPDAGWHHRMNVLIHLVNTLLLFAVFRAMTGSVLRSALVAALFGVHPLHVESVAWVAERKDLLSALFWILTMGAYLRYVRRPRPARYLAVMATFAAGLLCKPMPVTLPFALLLLDWWPLGRMSRGGFPHPLSRHSRGSAPVRLLREKLPLLGISAGSCAVAFLAQAKGESISSLSLGSRVANALLSYVVYLKNTAWPSSLAVFYPNPFSMGAGIPSWQVAGAAVILVLSSFLVLRAGKRHPFLPVGWLWYLGTMIPVIGLVQVGSQALADRYTYVPLVGIFLAVSWGGAEIGEGLRYRKQALGAAAGLLLAALSIAAVTQAGYWRNSVTLFSRAVSVTEGNWFAWYGLGIHYGDVGRHREAVSCYREAVRIRPDFAEGWNNMGADYEGLGQYEQAVICYGKALRIRPGYADAWYNLEAARRKLGPGP